MFFKKSREAKKLADGQAQVDAVKGVQQQLDAALVLPDKAERLMKAAELSQAIDTLTNLKNTDLRMKSRYKMFVPYFGVTGSTLGAAFAVTVCLHFPPAIMLLALPSAFGGLWVGSARCDRAQKRMTEENKTFFDGLAAVKVQADQAVESLLRDNLKELAASPKISEALDRVPQLREHFSQAFVLKTAGSSGPAQEPPKLVGKGSLTL